MSDSYSDYCERQAARARKRAKLKANGGLEFARFQIVMAVEDAKLIRARCCGSCSHYSSVSSKCSRLKIGSLNSDNVCRYWKQPSYDKNPVAHYTVDYDQVVDGWKET